MHSKLKQLYSLENSIAYNQDLRISYPDSSPTDISPTMNFSSTDISPDRQFPEQTFPRRIVYQITYFISEIKKMTDIN